MRDVKHLQRHKQVYTMHEAGKTYGEIANELGISTARARQIALRWERELELMKEDDEQERRYNEEVEVLSELSNERLMMTAISFLIANVLPDPDVLDDMTYVRREALMHLLEYPPNKK